MINSSKIEEFWDDAPIDVSTEVNFIWSIANKLRGPYQSDKYKDVIIPMVIIRRFECALDDTREAVAKNSRKYLHIRQRQCIEFPDINFIIQAD